MNIAFIHMYISDYDSSGFFAVIFFFLGTILLLGTIIADVIKWYVEKKTETKI